MRLEQISLIGQSMGGHIAMAYAATQPQRVERIVINDIGPEPDPRGIERVFKYVGEAPQRFDTLDDVAVWYRENYPVLRPMNDDVLRQYVGHSVKPHSESGLTWKMDPAIRRSPHRATAADAWAWVTKITAPVLLIRGGESDILASEVAQRMVQRMGSCRMVEVPGVGHAPRLTAPAVLSAINEMFGLP